jgi:hypothetical protein
MNVQLSFPFAAPMITRLEEEAIENLADGFMGALSCPPGAVIDAETLIGLREGFKGYPRLKRLPVPDDTFLDELLREMAEWHDLPLAEGNA